ncbi:unnamed protein product [Rotaria sp. Silwood1]|nr:unnamed protein product [Rotaria sp. Silwood1]CAF1535022.1 unnamed protein product [Rotaria sp. Silwood1]
MSEQSSTLTTDQNHNDNTEKVTIAVTSQSVIESSSSETFNSDVDFQEIYLCAKHNRNWPKLSNALMAHPNWLTVIPDDHQWAMLHQIVYSGNIKHLDEVLALQTTNSNFRLLCETRDGKTVREIAAEQVNIHSEMLHHIEQFIVIDELLNNAKNRCWNLVKQCITLRPDIVNKKPPYRRFYLIHHLAYVGNLDIFKELNEICHFRLDLYAENQTISQLARQHNKIAFAEYIESLQIINLNKINEDTSVQTVSSNSTGILHYNFEFYENFSKSFILQNINLNNTEWICFIFYFFAYY